MYKYDTKMGFNGFQMAGNGICLNIFVSASQLILHGQKCYGIRYITTLAIENNLALYKIPICMLFHSKYQIGFELIIINVSKTAKSKNEPITHASD
jgi:hypothetical protein